MFRKQSIVYRVTVATQTHRADGGRNPIWLSQLELYWKNVDFVSLLIVGLVPQKSKNQKVKIYNSVIITSGKIQKITIRPLVVSKPLLSKGILELSTFSPGIPLCLLMHLLSSGYIVH